MAPGTAWNTGSRAVRPWRDRQRRLDAMVSWWGGFRPGIPRPGSAQHGMSLRRHGRLALVSAFPRLSTCPGRCSGWGSHRPAATSPHPRRPARSGRKRIDSPPWRSRRRVDPEEHPAPPPRSAGARRWLAGRGTSRRSIGQDKTRLRTVPGHRARLPAPTDEPGGEPGTVMSVHVTPQAVGGLLESARPLQFTVSTTGSPVGLDVTYDTGIR